MTEPVRLALWGGPLFCVDALKEDPSIVLVRLHDSPEAILCHWGSGPPPLQDSVAVVGTNTSAYLDIPLGVDLVRTVDLPKDLMEKVRSVPEVAIGLMLALHRHLVPAIQGTNRDYYIAPYQLAGKRAVIVGRGRISWQIAEILSAFRMEVLRAAPSLHTYAEPLSEAAVLIVACPPQAETVVTRTYLEFLPPDAIVVDVSQPGVMDFEAAAKMVRKGQLRGVASDVGGYTDGGDILGTPHIGGSTAEARRMTELGVVREMVRRLRG